MRNPDAVRIAWHLMMLGIAVALVWLFWHALTYILVAGLAAYLLNPFVYWLERRRIPRFAGILLVFLVLALIVGLAVWLLVPPFVHQTVGAVTVMSQSSEGGGLGVSPWLAQADSLVQRVGAGVGLDTGIGSFRETLQHKLTSFLEGLAAAVLKLLTVVSYAVTIPIMVFFLLLDHRKMKRWLLAQIPNRYYELTVLVIENIDHTVGTYLRAVLIEIVAVASLSALALWIVGVQWSLIIGIVAGFANAIPYFGPFIGMILAVGSALLSGGGLPLAAGAAVAMLAVQLIDNNLVYPIVIGRNTQMHPLLIMLTVIAAGYVLGILGMFLAVPVFFLIRGVLQVLHRNLKEFEIL